MLSPPPLDARFHRAGAATDLDEAIESLREADDHVDYLDILGVTLRKRYEHNRSATDIVDAVEAGQRALASTTADAPHRWAILMNLGATLQARFRQSGWAEHGHHAVDMSRRAVTAANAADSIGQERV